LIARRHHGNVKVSTITADFVHGADYKTLERAAQTFKGLVAEGATIKRGEGEKAREQIVNDFRGAINWLIEDAERNVSKQRYKGLGE
ncbi:DNA gyrase subunit B, partial [Acinetobacter baumannii]